MSESNLPPPLPRPVYQACAFVIYAAKMEHSRRSAIYKMADDFETGFLSAAYGSPVERQIPNREDYRQAAQHLASIPTAGRVTDLFARAAQLARDCAQVQP